MAWTISVSLAGRGQGDQEGGGAEEQAVLFGASVSPAIPVTKCHRLRVLPLDPSSDPWGTPATLTTPTARRALLPVRARRSRLPCTSQTLSCTTGGRDDGQAEINLGSRVIGQLPRDFTIGRTHEDITTLPAGPAPGLDAPDGDAQLRTLQGRKKERRGVMAKKLAYDAPDESAPERAGR